MTGQRRGYRIALPATIDSPATNWLISEIADSATARQGASAWLRPASRAAPARHYPDRPQVAVIPYQRKAGTRP